MNQQKTLQKTESGDRKIGGHHCLKISKFTICYRLWIELSYITKTNSQYLKSLELCSRAHAWCTQLRPLELIERIPWNTKTQFSINPTLFDFDKSILIDQIKYKICCCDIKNFLVYYFYDLGEKVNELINFLMTIKYASNWIDEHKLKGDQENFENLFSAK